MSSWPSRVAARGGGTMWIAARTTEARSGLLSLLQMDTMMVSFRCSLRHSNTRKHSKIKMISRCRYTPLREGDRRPAERIGADGAAAVVSGPAVDQRGV